MISYSTYHVQVTQQDLFIANLNLAEMWRTGVFMLIYLHCDLNDISYTTSSSFTISWLAQLPKIWLVPLVQERTYHSRIVFGHVYQCKALDFIDLCEYIKIPCNKSTFVKLKQFPIILACVGSHA